MTAVAIPRPDAGEYASSYGGYVSRVPDGDLLRTFESQRRETQQLLAGLSEQKALHARMHAPEYYQQPSEVLRTDGARSGEIETLLTEKLERWEALEQKAKAAG